MGKLQAIRPKNVSAFGLSLPEAEAHYWTVETRKAGVNRSAFIGQLLREFGVPRLERLKAARDVQGEAA